MERLLEPPTERQKKYRLAFSIIGILVGVSIFLTFGLVYRNPDAALWGLASGQYHSQIAKSWFKEAINRISEFNLTLTKVSVN